MKLINKVLHRFNRHLSVYFYCVGKHKDMDSLFTCKDCSTLFKGEKND